MNLSYSQYSGERPHKMEVSVSASGKNLGMSRAKHSDGGYINGEYTVRVPSGQTELSIVNKDGYRMMCELIISAIGHQPKTIELLNGGKHTETIFISADTWVRARVRWKDWRDDNWKDFRIKIILDDSVKVGVDTQNSQLSSLLFQLQQHTLE